ncbi:T9SS type A sorting domain-containing protein [Apibacter adventoris]|uniref:T9SS type A sorting domain-containing protein n=1 Tax=Apibacter adventoris TaxID=1679466 RepID=UPI000CF619C4|nr:T9SS type A sorting domain-containing protein [Apibacter adventoris]PQL93999.1 hypothetical protein C4S76_06400 [Apibacter adventoris]
MKKILLFMLVLSVFSTHSLASRNYSAEKQNYLKKNFVASTNSQYDPMDVLGILNILLDTYQTDYTNLGLTWEDITEAINGNPDAMIEKAKYKNSTELPFTWKTSGKYKVLTRLNLSVIRCYSFDGKYFKNLEVLFCPTDIKYLNVSKNYMLKELYCSFGFLANIDIDMSNNRNLEELSFFACGITSLNISNNPKLKGLYCTYNKLKVLDVSKNPDLEVIECEDNQIMALDVSKNPKLTTLICWGNKIPVLDVSKNTELVEFDCGGNQLTVLDISKNPKLVQFDCEDNHLKVLDTSKNPLLESLSCGNNQLTYLDVIKNPKLVEFSCGKNQLKVLDISKNPKLEEFGCEKNQLTVLDISNNPNLKSIYCFENQLKLSTLKGDFSKLDIYSKLGPQALLKGGTKGFFELIDLSTEYNINGTLTIFKWYDKATNQEVGVFASKGTFYAGPANAGKTLICKMTNTLYPGLILEYEVKISNSTTQGLSAKTMDFNIPENFTLTSSQAEASNLKIFPNPIIDILKINTPLHIETVSVYDYSGNEVKKISPVSSKEINLQGLSSGNYILTIQTSQGVITKKIIKK